MTAGDWFASRTSASDDYSVTALAERKAAAGLAVSVVLPARNEAATVGHMVKAVTSLVDDLVDEVVVMNGGSTDRTPEVAAQAGARVHDDSAVLAEFGPAQGKGDALWRALGATTGDIVVYIDADIRNPDPRFVWGLLGPLLCDERVALVKGFYDRPLALGETVDRAGGGRVTELMARPLLNLLFPELAGLVQPLSGEYAARRELLEALPFFTGYGVEVGLLVDTLRLAGLDAIAQVDLGVRVHHNQPLADLSTMACGIARVLLQRVSEDERVNLRDLPEGYTQFGRDSGGRVVEQVGRVHVEERPPFRTTRIPH